jgi:hypothetical protein
MVLLSMTEATVDVVKQYKTLSPSIKDEIPSLDSPQNGNPISHAQLIHITKILRGKNIDVHLDQLLKGSTIYQQPKAESKPKSSEYEQLMARLRKEDEARKYDRMLNPDSLDNQNTTFAHILNQNNIIAASQDDDVTYKEVNRQVSVIFNVLVTIICCGIAIWIAARRWNTPARLALAMTGSLIVGIAEVVVYTGYLRRVTEAKAKEKKKKEVKTVQDSWVTETKKKPTSGNLRSRKAAEK